MLGSLAIFSTFGLVLIGLVEGVQFQSPPTMIGSLDILLRMLFISTKNIRTDWVGAVDPAYYKFATLL